MGSSSSKRYKKSFIPEQKIEGSPESIPRWKHKKIDGQLEKAICQIRIYDNKIGKEKLNTGFLCKILFPDEFSLLPVLIANNHIINEENFKENKEIDISFDDGKINKKLNIDSKAYNRKFYTSQKYDTTIIEIFPNKDNFYCFLEVSLDEKM